MKNMSYLGSVLILLGCILPFFLIPNLAGASFFNIPYSEVIVFLLAGASLIFIYQNQSYLVKTLSVALAVIIALNLFKSVQNFGFNQNLTFIFIILGAVLLNIGAFKK